MISFEAEEGKVTLPGILHKPGGLGTVGAGSGGVRDTEHVPSELVVEPNNGSEVEVGKGGVAVIESSEDIPATWLCAAASVYVPDCTREAAR